MDEKTRTIGLTVQTKGTEEWLEAFRHISSVTQFHAERGRYVSVYTSSAEDSPDWQTENLRDEFVEKLTHDENTLFKVRSALIKAIDDAVEHATARLPRSRILEKGEARDQLITDMIAEMQNAGIFFRERAQ